MFCNKCGNNIEGQMKFCNKCGTMITTDKLLTVAVSSSNNFSLLNNSNNSLKLLNKKIIAIIVIVIILLISFISVKNIVTQQGISANNKRLEEAAAQNEETIQICIEGFLSALADFDQNEMTRYLSQKAASDVNDTIDIATLLIPTKYLKLLKGIPATRAILNQFGIMPILTNSEIITDFKPTINDLNSDFNNTVVSASTIVSIEILGTSTSLNTNFKLVKINGSWLINDFSIE